MPTMTLTKLKTLEEVRDTLKALETLSDDITLPADEIRDLTIEGMTVPGLGLVKFTGESVTQLAEKAGIPGSVFGWLLANQPQEAAVILDERWNGYIHQDGKRPKLMIRSRLHRGELKVRAVLSERYGVIDSLQLVEALMACLPEHVTRERFSGMQTGVWLDSLTGRLSMKAIVGDVNVTQEKDPHKWGLLIGCDECGHGSAYLDALYDRVFCTNQFAGLGLGRDRQAHVVGKAGISAFESKVGSWMQNRLSNLEGNFERYWNLRNSEIVPEAAADRLVKIGYQSGLPKRELKVIAETILPRYIDEVGSTDYAIVNSLTEFTRDMEDRLKQEFWESASGKVIETMNNGRRR